MATEIRLVRVGADHDCAACRRPIPRGSVAAKSERRAETYHERCHADGRGLVAYYRHPECQRQG